MPTIKQALQDAKSTFPDPDSASLDAQLLLCQVLDVGRAYLLAHPEQTLSDAEWESFQTLAARRADHEPVAYILGKRAFYDREFRVTPDVLIPRPETEHLLEAALDIAKEQQGIITADIGTGSGAIAVTYAAHAPQSTVYATDISESALAVARGNAADHGVDVQFLQGHLAQPLIDSAIPVEMVLANLPYVADGDALDATVARYEPHLALFSGDDGLRLIRELLEQIAAHLPTVKFILLEMGSTQGKAVKQLAHDLLHTEQVTVLQDYAGLDRTVRIAL